MNFIQKIQNKTTAEKMRIIWIVVIIAAILLVGIWIISAKYYKNTDKDTTFFESIGNGVKEVKDNYKKN